MEVSTNFEGTKFREYCRSQNFMSTKSRENLLKSENLKPLTFTEFSKMFICLFLQIWFPNYTRFK